MENAYKFRSADFKGRDQLGDIGINERKIKTGLGLLTHVTRSRIVWFYKRTRNYFPAELL
jgi:hypothetical protein